MSLRAITQVIERSRAKGSNFTMLLMIADYANDEGRNSFASVRTLGVKSRLTGRGGEQVIQGLVEDGEVRPRWVPAEHRLYFDIRCLCEWDAYRREGGLPAKDDAPKKTRENFAHKLEALAAQREADAASSKPVESVVTENFSHTVNPDVSEIHNTVSEIRDTVSEIDSNPLYALDLDPIDPNDPRERRTAATPPERSRVSAEAPLRHDAPNRAPEALLAAWRELAPDLPQPLGLSHKRRRQVEARLREHPFAWWRAAIARIAGSSFCHGRNARGFVASFAWLIGSDDVGLKVTEGAYDDRSGFRPARDAAPSRDELEQARNLRRAHGGCMHATPCASSAACEGALIRQWRDERAEAMAS